MKVTTEVWQERMNNLMERRKNYIPSTGPHIDYGELLKKVSIGRKVLDVGCGSMEIKRYMHKNCFYTGIDPFPVGPFVEKMQIEECTYGDKVFDTVIVFAVLDGLRDLVAAVEHIKRVCAKNVIILTGVDIPPDQYHTLQITEAELTDMMAPFKVGYREKLHEKILFIEYIRNEDIVNL